MEDEIKDLNSSILLRKGLRIKYRKRPFCSWFEIYEREERGNGGNYGGGSQREGNYANEEINGEEGEESGRSGYSGSRYGLGSRRTGYDDVEFAGSSSEEEEEI